MNRKEQIEAANTCGNSSDFLAGKKPYKGNEDKAGKV